MNESFKTMICMYMFLHYRGCSFWLPCRSLNRSMSVTLCLGICSYCGGILCSLAPSFCRNGLLVACGYLIIRGPEWQNHYPLGLADRRPKFHFRRPTAFRTQLDWILLIKSFKTKKNDYSSTILKASMFFKSIQWIKAYFLPIWTLNLMFFMQ